MITGIPPDGLSFGHLKNGQESVQESAAVQAAAAEKERGCNKAAAGPPAFKGGVGPGAHQQAVGHLLLADAQGGAVFKQLGTHVGFQFSA